MKAEDALTAPVDAAVHTPGPWFVERRWSNGGEIIPRITCASDDDRGCGWIADLIGAPYLGHKSTLPNARLIAAAPDLLSALEQALQWIEVDESTHGRTFGAGNVAREAIAKATGVEIESEVL